MTYSMDLRERVVAAVNDGESTTEVARRFAVSRPAVREWRDRAERGELEPRKPGPKGPRKLTKKDDKLMRRLIAVKPGITAKELMPQLSVVVVESTVCRRLKKLGLSLKKSR